MKYLFTIFFILTIYFLSPVKLFSEDKKQLSELINLIKELNNNISQEQFGFEINFVPKASGMNIILLGYIDNKISKNSWFLLVDNYALNMPIEGYINEEYFILNPANGLISKFKNCTFTLNIHAESNEGMTEDFIVISDKKNKSNKIKLSFPELSQDLGTPEITKDNNSVIIRGKEYNYSFKFDQNKLKSHFIYSPEAAENAFSLYLYYDFKELNLIKEATIDCLKYFDEKKMTNYVDSDNLPTREILFLILSIRFNFLNNSAIEEWLNEGSTKDFKSLKENYSKLRSIFFDYIFADMTLVKKWTNLNQFKDKWKNKLIMQ